MFNDPPSHTIMHEEVSLTREVDAIQIPSGDTITLPTGTPVVITQTLGGTYTVATSAGLARISSSDADALGVDPDEKQEKQAEADRLADATLEEQVWHQMKQVFDPEIPVDIVNLGLVYDCTLSEVDSGTDVDVKMTADAQARIMSLSEINDARVELVWDPPWNQDMISEEGKMKLGMM